ncbi:MAG TPA: AsnC family transcriptional regulator [Clostridiales bacterium]|nr:AsnC family transcriptional regulator [Clostridiales bacterium]
MKKFKEIAEVLEKESRTTPASIAAMLNIGEDETAESIREMESEGIIRGYSAVVDREKAGYGGVSALIEVKVTPQRGEGFDRVAQRIYSYPQVRGCYLMSGGFDLAVLVEGSDMKEVALFVAEKLAVQDSVLSTSTHFVLRKYKDMGFVFGEKHQDDREGIIL